ncbi:nephrocystin-3-like [Haliotis cracherodii]|uniref:nephrocystin-3-like n=1 Tax=Haliotis cracherodii TaxID=6455 RepID=UPI0039ED09AF
MGVGGSFLRGQDDDDILGTDLDGNGVIKRIPIEIKPRGKLGPLRSVTSFGKKSKGGSLRSALSIDLENPEVDRIKKDFDMYKLNKDNEIMAMQKKEQKLEMENKRMRAELLALQNTCTKLRNEKESCLDAEMQALARASAFESDRDKVQRQFKIFRETKENEIQNLLRAKRELESRLTKLSHGFTPEDLDTASRSEETSIGNSNPGDWWTALESEPSLGSTVQLHQPAFLRGPEFANSVMELEGPFTNVNKDDWSTALANLTQVIPAIPDHSISSVCRLYISAPNNMHTEVELLAKEYAPSLKSLCESEGRGLVIVHLPYDDSDNLSPLMVERQIKMRKKQIELASVFLVLLGDTTNRFTSFEVKHGHLESTEIRPTVYCFRETGNKRTSLGEVKEIKTKIKESRNVKVISGYSSPSKGAEMVYTELVKIFKMELGVSLREKTEAEELTTDVPELFEGVVWDVHYDYEQMEALGYAVHSSCELGFERYYERLNAHVSAAGPLPPLLVTGGSGSGRSLLLSKWIQLQQEKCPGTLVLFHFVGSPSSISADPIIMIRRLTSQLMQHVTTPPALTGDPGRLVEEFPRWLEKVSAKSPGGTILILDSIDRFPQVDVHLKWLLDPLPVDARVIVSCHEDTCLQTWRSWPTLCVESLTNKNVKELVRAEVATLDAFVSPEFESKILTHCRTPSTCCPLYVMVLARHIASFCQHEDKLRGSLDSLLTTVDCEDLYLVIIDILRAEYETDDTRGYMRQILCYLCASRCGMREEELFRLIPNLTWNLLAQFYEAFSSHLLIKYHSGLLTFAHEQVRQAVFDYCFGKDNVDVSFEATQQELVEYFTNFLHPGKVTCRVCDELPWLIKLTGDKEMLKSCILDLCVFQRLYAKGRCSELISYWQIVGGDKNSMPDAYFTATKKLEETSGHFDGLLTPARIADMYETLGRFLKDMGLLKQALPALQRALEVRETALDPDHPVVARSLHQLAGLHAQWGKFCTAQAYYQQALEIYENAYGSDHYLLAKELDALALLYQKQEKHEQAEPLKKQAMSIKKKARTPRVNSGQLRGIDLLRRRTLHLEELAMGSDSPEQARTLNELGVLYYLQSNVDTAETFFKKSLEMREATLGPDHADLAQSLNNLAAFYNDRKQFDKAEPLYERALQIRLKYLSGDSPACAGIIKNLAMLYKKQGKFEKAEPLYKQAVDIREKSFGPHHPSVATALVNLAVLYSQQNKFSEAEPLYERALKIYEESFGPSHPTVAETLRNLAVMKYEMKDFETAAKLYKKATEMKESETNYAGKVLSRRSSSGDTNSTIKNILHN